MKIVMYAHGGSKNHGCEAIVRSTSSLIKEVDSKPSLLSYQGEEDRLYGLEELVDIKKAIYDINRRSSEFLVAYVQQKFFKNYHHMDALRYKKGIYDMEEQDIALFIGGDNYCYSDVKNYRYVNDYMSKKAKKLVLWGTSVEPELLQDQTIREDIARFDLIVARESLSYDALRKVNSNTVLLPDPAFFLQSETVELPEGFEENNTVGINVSPLVIQLENGKGILLSNYEKLIEHILKETSYKVALIPHVVWEGNDDRIPLQYLYEKYQDSGRVLLVEDHNCMQQKYIISKCKLFMGARTHSTIAAYSTEVPTIVIGYSVKARGIAKDLFGTEKQYVVSAQGMKTENELVDAFQFLEKNQKCMKEMLHVKMSEYQELREEYKRVL